jgi:hypothetical protein
MINSIMTRWVGHVALMGDRRGASRVLAGKPDKKDNVKNIGASGYVSFSIMEWKVKAGAAICFLHTEVATRQ